MVQTDAKGETGATMARMIREEGILPERSEWFRSSGIIGTAEGYCVDNRWLSTGGGNENAVYRKAEEPYGCGWVGPILFSIPLRVIIILNIKSSLQYLRQTEDKIGRLNRLRK